jgi:hypothetical protein
MTICSDAMTETLADSELDHLLNFIGHGRLDADVWFMGMEEAGGGEANIVAILNLQEAQQIDTSLNRGLPFQ